MKQKKQALHLGIPLLFGSILVITVLANPQSPSTQQPGVISAAAPIFPPLANAARVSGDVVVEVTIDATGIVTSAHAEGHALLRKVSEAAASRWRFVPAEKDAASRLAKLIFTFRSLEKELPEDQITPIFHPPYRIEVMHNPNILQNHNSK